MLEFWKHKNISKVLKDLLSSHFMDGNRVSRNSFQTILVSWDHQKPGNYFVCPKLGSPAGNKSCKTAAGTNLSNLLIWWFNLIEGLAYQICYTITSGYLYIKEKIIQTWIVTKVRSLKTCFWHLLETKALESPFMAFCRMSGFVTRRSNKVIEAGYYSPL